MSYHVPMQTPGGVIWVEIEEPAETLALTGIQDKALRTFQETVEALKENARYIREKIKTLGEELAPDETEIEFGIKAGAEAGTPFFGLAKASGEASYTVKLKWGDER
ncbi:MAG: CU044_2847 family protein [Anaerolineales bacterium]